MDPNNDLESESIPTQQRHGWIDYIPKSQNFWAAVVVILILVALFSGGGNGLLNS
jgi:hypothetical protein